MIGSTAAVAIACENRPFTVKVNGQAEVTPESASQNSELMVGDGPKAGEIDESENSKLKKQIDDAAKTVKEKEERVKQASRKYSEASNKGRPYEQGNGNAPKDIVDKINETEKELLKAQKELETAKQKLQKLRDSRPANDGHETGLTIQA
ncbi:lipoprotein, (VlcA) [Mycoplasma mycoides subsp. capri]|nr:lipoprotein, (VlcA) [Mycoplasma mycoides]UZK63956.1 lipoprotein, (VlcA) [Mycoplasma mycoides subsp. capri]